MSASAHEVRRALIGVQFPAGRAELVEHVRYLGGPPEIIDALQRVEDGVYDNAEQVARAVSALENW